MRSPSRGFCFCLPVRLGTLVVSFFLFAGSISLASLTLHSLTGLSSHITSGQAAGHYLTTISWISLTAFSLLGFLAALLQHPLILTICARFLLYHVAINLVFNIVMIVVLFTSFPEAESALNILGCNNPLPQFSSLCDAFTFLERLAWIYVVILLPAVVLQIYGMVILNRFIFVVTGEWDAQREDAQSKEKDNSPTSLPTIKRGRSVSQTIGRGGRRRDKALWFNMETPSGGPGPEESFLPSMVITTPIKDAHFSKEMPPVPPVPPIPPALPRPPSSPIFPKGGHVSPVRSQADIRKEAQQKMKSVPRASFTSIAGRSVESPPTSSSSPLGFIALTEAAPSALSPMTAPSTAFATDVPTSGQPLLSSFAEANPPKRDRFAGIGGYRTGAM